MSIKGPDQRHSGLGQDSRKRGTDRIPRKQVPWCSFYAHVCDGHLTDGCKSSQISEAILRLLGQQTSPFKFMISDDKFSSRCLAIAKLQIKLPILLIRLLHSQLNPSKLKPLDLSPLNSFERIELIT